VPRQELGRVLRELWDSLKPDGVLFSSNPRGNNWEGWSGERYGCYHDLEEWRRHGEEAGFEEVRYYYRPPGKPRDQQPWLATVWRKIVRTTLNRPRDGALTGRGARHRVLLRGIGAS
jgi:SAM-dependent methyltransferase